MKLSPKMAKSLKMTGLKLKKASPTILTVISVGGVVATAVLSAKAAPKAVKLVEDGKQKEDMTDISKLELVAINIKYGWKPFIPVIATAAGTIACILGSNILNKKQQAALTSAYMMLESQYREYRKKVIEFHGEEEDAKIINDIIKSSIKPISEDDEVITFAYEMLDDYFESTTANVAFAIQQVNYYMLADGYVTLSQFYKFLGLNELANIEENQEIGWSCNDLQWNYGVCPLLEYRFHDKQDLNGMKIREIELFAPPTWEAIDIEINPDHY